MRLVRGGPLVAAVIKHEAGLWSAEIDGTPCGEADADPAAAAGVFRIWHGASRIDRTLFEFRLSVKSWAMANDPTHPSANAFEVIDLNRMRSLF